MIPSLLLEGVDLSADVANVLRGAVVQRTIEGASTLTLDVFDGERALLKSKIFSQRTTARVDGYAFELVQVRKIGDNLSIVLEDLPVAALRRRTTPLKVAANTLTHIQFAERLVSEESWLKLGTPDELKNAERSRIELARGNPDETEEPEDSWTALGRIAEERGWRRYISGTDTVSYVSETYLASQPPTYVLREHSDGVESINFDFDSGKPIATASVGVRSERWSVPIGASVSVEGCGPADGIWIVSSTSRSLFGLLTDVRLTRARPVLPEPEESSSASDITGVIGGGGGSGTPTWVVPTATGIIGGGHLRDLEHNTYPDDPANLVWIGQGEHRLIPGAADSFAQVKRDFGRTIFITDSYRSVASQAVSYAKDPSRYGKPGGSAHNEGRAVDVDLKKVGVNNQSPDPKLWDRDPVWRRLNEAFEKNGWGNYQYRAGTTKGRTSEPWHWSWRVLK